MPHREPRRRIRNPLWRGGAGSSGRVADPPLLPHLPGSLVIKFGVGARLRSG